MKISIKSLLLSLIPLLILFNFLLVGGYFTPSIVYACDNNLKCADLTGCTGGRCNEKGKEIIHCIIECESGTLIGCTVIG